LNFNDVTSVLLQPDGKILVLGSLMLHEPNPRSDLVRLNPDGSLDTTFPALGQRQDGINFNYFQSMAFGPRNTLYVAGNFRRLGLFERAGIARVNLGIPAGPVIRSASVGPRGPVSVSFSTTPGRSYELHASANLTDWAKVASAVADQEFLELSDQDAASQERRFYRVIEFMNVPPP
jgi:hypothetical protein